MDRLRATFALTLALAAVEPGWAEEPPGRDAHAIPPSAYLSFVPLEYPRIVRATPESEAVQLWGDRSSPSYVDVAPVDGIDDARGALLMALAVRFSPYLVRNTTSIPMDWRKFVWRSRSFPLHVDRWELSTSPPLLVRREEVDLAALPDAPCPGSDPRSAPLRDDCALLRLLAEFDPDAPEVERGRTLAERPRAAPFTVMYLDFPGDDPESWKREYTTVLGGALARDYRGFKKAYVHPFVAAGPGVGGGLELVLQYWFFYPFNDSANKHEGDWEHVNVVVSPRSRVGSPLAAADVRAILARGPDALGGDDPLVVARVEYYLHGKVFSLDLGSPNVYAPRSVWEKQVAALPRDRLGEEKILTEMRARAYLDRGERELNTHPVTFIGGDSKGLDLLLGLPGARSQDSHANYPLHGTFTEVAPGGTAEEISSDFELQRYFGEKAAPWPARVERFDDAALLEIVPDWERVRELVRSNAEARRAWSWLLLPLRWGYPAVESPFAGIISHAETGNVSPPGPAYNGGWNRTGASGGFYDYQPHRYWPLFPLSPLDTFSNRLGFLNAPVTALTVLPPLDLLYRLVFRPIVSLLPGGLSPVYIPTAPEQHRVVGLAFGGFLSSLPSNMGAIFLNSAQIDQITQRLEAARVTGTVTVATTSSVSFSPSFQIQFYMTPRLVTQNTFRYMRGTIRLDALSSDTHESSRIDGTFQLFEWAGSLRLNLFTGKVEPFVKIGYGYSWYRIQGVAVDGTPISPSSSPFLHAPSGGSFWPNTFHYGVGLEATLLEPEAPLTGIGLGLKVEANVFTHSLGLGLRAQEFGITADTSISRPSFDFALVVSF